MKKTIILLAGYPATGKSYLCNEILKIIPDFVIVSLDEKKEILWDRYGFTNQKEKADLERKALILYYQSLKEQMIEGSSIISDYPFSEKQKGTIQELSETYGYQVLTIRLIGDLEILYERSRSRDLNPDRHLGHMVSAYQKGDILEDRSKADQLVTHDIFMDRCQNRGYGSFQLGHLIELDVTHYEDIDYPAVIKEIYEFVM